MDHDAIDQDAVNRLEWERPGNWTGWLGTYSSARDSRWFVPNRTGALGLMPNTAHLPGKLVAAIPVLLVLSVMAGILWRAYH
jgi:uncharacterized membrane protein